MSSGSPMVHQDCRHYIGRSTPSGEVLQRCRLGANGESPFSCPEACLFFEARNVSAAGWAQAPSEPMSNTADGLIGLPPQKRKRPKKKR